MVEIRTLNKLLLKKYLNFLTNIDQFTILKYGDLFSSERWNKKNFMIDLPGKWELSCLALEKNQPIGFCICSFFNTNKCYVYRFVVSGESREKNVGKEMTNFILKKCIEKGIDKVLLEVNKKNRSALKFYEKLKFKIIKKADLMKYLHSKGKFNNCIISGNHFVENGYPEKKYVLERNLS